MRTILAIAGRELRASFVTPLAYVVLSSFVLISGFFFFTLLQEFNAALDAAAMMPQMHANLNEWVVTPYYQTLLIVLIFLIPVLTMRAIAEEKRSGTFELLATSPLKVSEIIWGKVVGTGGVVVTMITLAFLFPLVLIRFADPEVLPIFVGYFGLIIFSFAFVALGVAISCFTKSQTVACVLGAILFLLFYVIDAPAARIGGTIASVLSYLSPATHVEQMLKGVVQGVDLVYFASLLAFGIFLANRALDAERYRS